MLDISGAQHFQALCLLGDEESRAVCGGTWARGPTMVVTQTHESMCHVSKAPLGTSADRPTGPCSALAVQGEGDPRRHGVGVQRGLFWCSLRRGAALRTLGGGGGE